MKLAFILLLVSISTIAADEVQKLRTTHGIVSWRETESKKSADGPGYVIIQGVPTDSELQKMEADATQAPALISEYVPEALRSKDLLKNLDLALAGWLRSTNAGRESADRVTRIIGAACGQECISNLNARWAIVSTDGGTDVALVKDAPNLSYRPTFVWTFPFSAIRNQIDDKKSKIVWDLYASLKEAIEKNEAQ